MGECFLRACSSWIVSPYVTQDPYSRGGSTHSGMGPPTLIWCRHFLIVIGFFFPNGSNFFQVHIKLSTACTWHPRCVPPSVHFCSLSKPSTFIWWPQEIPCLLMLGLSRSFTDSCIIQHVSLSAFLNRSTRTLLSPLVLKRRYITFLFADWFITLRREAYDHTHLSHLVQNLEYNLGVGVGLFLYQSALPAFIYVVHW